MGDAKTVRYFLDIMAPGRRQQVLAQFSTTTPLQAIHVGDVLHSQSMLDSADSMAWLKVVGVVHRIWDLTDHVSHLTTVFTAAVSEREALNFWTDGGEAEPEIVDNLEIVPLEELPETPIDAPVLDESDLKLEP